MRDALDDDDLLNVNPVEVSTDAYGGVTVQNQGTGRIWQVERSGDR